MNYFNNISNAVTTLIDGMKVTMGYFVRPREHVTLQYPDEVWPIPSRNIGVGELDTYNTIRSKLNVNIDDCIGCKACERACPVNCIHIDTYKGGPDEDLGTTSNGTKIKLLTASFIIDMSECMFCDLCTPPCPEDCITMTPDFQFISNDNLKKDVTPEQRWRDRNLLIYQFSKVSEVERKRLKAEADEAAKAKAEIMAAKKAAAEKAAADLAAKAALESAATAEVVVETRETETLETSADPDPKTTFVMQETESAPPVDHQPIPVEGEAKAEQIEDSPAPNSETSEASAETPVHANGPFEIIPEKEAPEETIETVPTDETMPSAEPTIHVDIPIETITKTDTFEESTESAEDKAVTETPENTEDSNMKERENG